jgi:hypothetical protein
MKINYSNSLIINFAIAYFDSTIKRNEIMTTFNLKNFLTSNREIVLNSYKSASEHKFFNQISLANYMTQVFNYMVENNPKSDKKAMSVLISAIDRVSNKNTSISGSDFRTESLKAKYSGTAFMAIV